MNNEFLRLSQTQLTLIETCPRKFQYIYFEQALSPLSPEQQEKQNWGSEFHLLMQQRQLGLPIEPIMQTYPKLNDWFSRLIDVEPEIFTENENIFRSSEYLQTFTLDNYLFTVIYDLIIADDQKAQILDWKTYPFPPKYQKLQNSWQTKLYLYVLANTSDYQPEQLSMIYWFVQSQPDIQSLTFKYDSQKHQQIELELKEILQKLNQWISQYLDYGESFPQVSENLGRCTTCNFAFRCGRSPKFTSAESNIILPDFETIQEVLIN
ncbi:MAG TPA: PD-(D/E)XK nuclease family protein [Allocoleopsis sp.]